MKDKFKKISFYYLYYKKKKHLPAHCGSMQYFSAPAHPNELHVAVSSA